MSNQEIKSNVLIAVLIQTNFGKMMAGGLLFGGLGAVAGAISSGGSSKNVKKDKYKVRIYLDDIENAMVELDCKSSKEAYNLIQTLSLLEEKYYKKNKKDDLKEEINFFETNTNSTKSYYDEISKIKTLLDQGAITQDEFQELKRKIIDS